MPRPHVIVNVAMTADGKLDSILRSGAKISSPVDLQRVDHLRAASDGVLVGGKTLLEENPGLSVRSAQLRSERIAAGKSENPARIGVVSKASLSLDSKFLRDTGRRLIYTTQRSSLEEIERLRNAGAEVFVMGQSRVDLKLMMDSLWVQGIRQLMVEGGGTLLAELFGLRLVDDLYIYIAPMIFSGSSAPTLADGEGFLPDQAVLLKLITVEPLDQNGGVLIHYTIKA